MPQDIRTLSAQTIRILQSGTLSKTEPWEESPTVHACAPYIIWHTFSSEKMGEEGSEKLTLNDTIRMIMYSQSSLRKPWEKHLTEIDFSDSININLKSVFSSNVDNYSKGFLLADTQLLQKIDKALGFLYERIQAMSEGIFCDTRAIDPNRAPGFVIDGWIVIPEYDRDLEYEIYKELGKVIRNNPDLLFNVHIIASKGRALHKIIPKNYKRYKVWSGYVC